ncbi:MAG: hypothetical protein EA376_06945 [Phycisphaeraceae bacterium]|nr:MAG: hypothetical protein EA376_06945 [Phycisphaeraceae bacterium]
MSSDSSSKYRLSPADAEALDALIDAGFEFEAIPSNLRARARRVADFLGLIDGPAPEASEEFRAAGPSMLINATMARVVRTPVKHTMAEPAAALSEADAHALDALIESGWSADNVDHARRARAQRIEGLLSILDDQAAPATRAEREDLITETMAAVMRRARSGAAAAGELNPARGRGFRLADIASLAAMLLIGASIIWPTLTSAIENGRQAACTSGLQSAAVGFTLYSNDNQGALPRTDIHRPARRAGAEWWHVGQADHSHSSNLFALVIGGYVSLSELACAGNPHAPINLDLANHSDWRSIEEVSYSYQLFTEEHPRWRGPARMVVLVDRSPIIERARRGERFDPLARSLNHRSRGQNVMFNDGSVEWLVTPVLEGGDNIWLPRSATGIPDPTLRGVERPDDAQDAFVGP